MAASLLIMPAVQAAPPARKPPPAYSPQKSVDDARALGEWMSRLLGAQEKAIGVLAPLDEAWLQLEQASQRKDQAAINAAHDRIDAAIVGAKTSLAEARAELDALPSLAGSAVMRELPVGHEARLRGFTLDTIKQFSQIVDRGETMSLAIATGESEVAKEFSDLLLDAREEVLYGQRSKIEIMAAAAKRGSVNELKLLTLGKATEAMHILFKGEVNIMREKPANFDMARLNAIVGELAALAKQAQTAQKLELAAFARDRKFIIPAMVAANERMLAYNGEWVDYMGTLPAEFTDTIAAIPAAGNDLGRLDALYMRFVAVEDEYGRHSQKLVENMRSF